LCCSITFFQTSAEKKVFSASFAEKRHTEHVWKLTIADSRY